MRRYKFSLTAGRSATETIILKYNLSGIKYAPTLGPNNPSLRYIPKETVSQVHEEAQMRAIIRALLGVGRSWRQPKHLLLDEHISKMYCMGAMEY